MLLCMQYIRGEKSRQPQKVRLKCVNGELCPLEFSGYIFLTKFYLKLQKKFFFLVARPLPSPPPLLVAEPLEKIVVLLHMHIHI